MKVVRFATLVATLVGARVAWAGDIPAVGVVESPGVSCPSIEAVQAALGRLRGGPAAGEPSFRLFIDRTADLAHVDLRDGANRSVLAREIPMTTATDCEHAAEAIALIVERHFRAVEWSPAGGVAGRTAPPPLAASSLPTGVRPAPALPASPPASPTPSPSAPVLPPTSSVTPQATLSPPLAPTPAPPAAAAVAESSLTAPPNVAATATAAASPTNPPALRFDPAVLPRLALGVGPAFWSRSSTFALSLDGRWRVAAESPIELGVGVLLPPLHTSAAVGSMGIAHVGAVPITASIGLTEALGNLALAAHLGVLWTIERGQSESIPAPATAWRTVVGLGLGASAAWPVTRWFRFTGSLDGYRTVLGRSYAVSGVGTVLEPSPWQAVIVLGAEWVVLP